MIVYFLLKWYDLYERGLIDMAFSGTWEANVFLAEMLIGILIPIVVPVAQALDPSLLVVTLSATLAGAVFGDHCSPISDTTILSSAGAGCSHIEHVSTQMLYALIVGFAAFVGYLVAGFSGANAWLSLAVTFAVLIASIVLLHLFWSDDKKKAA